MPANKILILSHNETLHRTPHISCSKFTLKLTYSKVEFQKFSGGKPPYPRLKGRGRGRGRGRKGRGEGREREGKGGKGREGEGEGGGKGGGGGREREEERDGGMDPPHKKFLDPPLNG